MSFSQWLNNSILPIFSYIINWLTNLLNALMGNYIFKIIIYIGIVTLIISTIYEIIGIFTNKGKKEKDKGD